MNNQAGLSKELVAEIEGLLREISVVVNKRAGNSQRIPDYSSAVHCFIVAE